MAARRYQDIGQKAKDYRSAFRGPKNKTTYQTNGLGITKNILQISQSQELVRPSFRLAD